MVFVPCLSRVQGEAPRLGEPLLNEYLRFVAARARPNTVLAQSYDLKVFFTVVAAAPKGGGDWRVLVRLLWGVAHRGCATRGLRRGGRRVGARSAARTPGAGARRAAPP